MWKNTWRLAWFANKTEYSIRSKPDCCDHYPFWKGRGKVCTWISWWVCHHQKGLMRSWWWWIDLAKWHTSFPPRKMPRPKRREGCSSCTCSSIMASQRTLCWIETQSSQASLVSFVEAHGVGAQDEHLIPTTNGWTNRKNELGYPIIPKELCGNRSTRLVLTNKKSTQVQT